MMNIKKLIKEFEFLNSVNDLELRAWASLFLLRKKLRWQSPSRKQQIISENLLKSLQNIRANISIKVHFVHSHLDKFSDDCGDVSNEQGERFHQDIEIMKDHHNDGERNTSWLTTAAESKGT